MFRPDPSGIFSVKPAGGVIPRNEFYLVTLRFTPRDAKPYSDFIECVLNNSTASIERVRVFGTGYTPKLSLTSRTSYFKPTCVGVVSSRKIALQNPTRIPIWFKWQIPK